MRNRGWFRVVLMTLAAGIVLAGPFIRDDTHRALWVTLGLGALLLCWRAFSRRWSFG